MLDNNIIYIDVFNHEDKGIKRVALEELVKKITETQVDTSFHLEFLKAQAIIARTQVAKLAKLFNGEGCTKHKGCDLCDEGHCIPSFDYKYNKNLWEGECSISKISQAVEETKGLIITIDGKPIDAKYHDTCGGSTENSENVMTNRVIYLRRVLCEYCSKSPNWLGFKQLSIEEIEEKLNVSLPKPNPTLKSEISGYIDEVERDEHGRIMSLRIAGKKFKGIEVMKRLGLDSTRFSFVPNVITFITRGKGEGLGLCQYGGNQMAIEGNSYKDILNYYYTGVEIKKLEKPCIEKPLSGRILMIDPGHGGENSQGIIGKHGVREKDVVLKLGIKLKDSLKKMGADIYLTREKDEYVSLSKRAEYANKIRPEFFISLHLNSFSNPIMNGCEIYHYRCDTESEALATSIMSSLSQNVPVLNRGIKTAEFYLLREVLVSSLQLEIEYITNPEKELLLSDESYIDKIVEAITSGIVEYYGKQ